MGDDNRFSIRHIAAQVRDQEGRIKALESKGHPTNDEIMAVFEQSFKQFIGDKTIRFGEGTIGWLARAFVFACWTAGVAAATEWWIRFKS